MMKYLLKALKSGSDELKENAVKAYLVFYDLGMVDTHFGDSGETFLHYLIRA